MKLALRELERPIPENAVLPDDPAADELWVEFARQVATQELEDLLTAEI